MKIKVDVTREDGSKYGSQFDSYEEAEAWVEKNHKGAQAEYEEVFSDELKGQRDHILRNTDWLFISDVPLDKKFRTAYKKYRQYLRDLKQKRAGTLLQFEDWLRVNEPQEFLDGGDSEEMVKKFTYYL